MSLILSGDAGVTFPNSTVQASAGVVLQVVQGTYTVQQSTTSTSYVASNISASITPKYATSKILIEVSLNAYATTGGGGYGFYTIYQNSTNVGTGTNACFACTVNPAVDNSMNLRYLDSPATTSAITYAVYYKASSGATAYTTTQGVSVITLSEIAG